MPVIFNEPLSFLQRLTEYMEHTSLLHRANTFSDSMERMKVKPPPLCDPVWRLCLKVHCVRFGLIFDFCIGESLAYTQKYMNKSLVFILLEWFS